MFPVDVHYDISMRKKQRLPNIFIRLIAGFAISLAYFLFNYLYCTNISPAYLYQGFVCNPASLEIHFISILFALVPVVFFLPMHHRRPSDWTIVFIYLFSYLPTTFMARHVLDKNDAIILLTVLLVNLLLLNSIRRLGKKCHFNKLEYDIVGVCHSVPLPDGHKGYSYILRRYGKRTAKKFFAVAHVHKIAPATKFVLLVIFVFLVLFYLWVADFRFNLNLSSIYERRLAAREISIPMFGYVVSIGRSMLTVFSVFFFLINREKKYLLILIVFILTIFSIDGTKSVVLIPILLFAVGFIFTKGYSLYLVFLIPVVLIFLSLVEIYLFHSDILSVYFARRMYAVPGFLNAIYFDFFSQHAKVFLTDSVGRFFVPPVYPVSTTFLIGRAYFSETTNANTGIWMGWYAHFGVIGVILVSILAGVILRFLDKRTQLRFPLLGSLVGTYIGIVWSEQMFHTSFLSDGIFYLLVVIVFVTQRNQLFGRNPKLGICRRQDDR